MSDPRILVFRKASDVADYPAKADKATVANIVTELSARTRVQRPTFVSHFLPSARGRSAFARQATVTRADLHHLADAIRNNAMTSDALDTIGKGWEVPADELGRMPKSGERDFDSTAQSLLIFAKDRIGQTSAEHGVYTVDPYGSDVSLIVVE